MESIGKKVSYDKIVTHSAPYIIIHQTDALTEIFAQNMLSRPPSSRDDQRTSSLKFTSVITLCYISILRCYHADTNLRIIGMEIPLLRSAHRCSPAMLPCDIPKWEVKKW